MQSFTNFLYMNIGDKLLDFSLMDIHQKERNTQEFFRKYALLVLFYSSNCTVCKAYTGRIAKLTQRFENDNLGIVLVDQNYVPNKDLSNEIQKHTFDMQVEDYLMHLNSTDYTVAKQYNTNIQPHAFLFNRSRNLVYKGAIDDNWKDAEFVTRVYLEDAIDYTLDGMEYDFPETEPIGSPIIV